MATTNASSRPISATTKATTSQATVAAQPTQYVDYFRVRIEPSNSIFFRGMEGSLLPVASAHGEGRAAFGNGSGIDDELVAVRYVDGNGQPTEHYPMNPNGSPNGVTGICNADGRVSIMMPHPERTLRTVNFSWAPPGWGAPRMTVQDAMLLQSMMMSGGGGAPVRRDNIWGEGLSGGNYDPVSGAGYVSVPGYGPIGPGM